ncbi:MAG: glutamate mutase L [Anaerolineae bacterium]
MPASLVQGDSLLAADIGGATTRVVLFDVVEGEYRFIASSNAPSTAEAPMKDVSEGLRNAITNLQAVIGRTFLDGDRRLITPSQADGTGVDAFVATMSAGPALKTVIVGLLSDVSLESGRRLAETTYARVLDAVGINDHRKPDLQIDRLMRLQPDMVIITGGTDGGASRSIHKMLEPVGLAGFLLASEKRPAVLFAGNQKLDDEVQELLGSVTSQLHFSANVRPSLDTEDLEPAARELASMYLGVRKRQLKGVDVIEGWSGGHVLPTAYAESRMLRFLGQVYGGARGGILGVDIGASGAVIAAGFKDKTALGVYPQFGLGENLPALLQYTTLEEILRWSPLDVSTAVLRDFLYQKALYPSSISVTKEDQSLAQSVTRQALYLAMQTAKRDFPRSTLPAKPGLLPAFEPILASGGTLDDAPTAGQGLLLLLDAIQPVGISTIIVDRNNLLPLLGAASVRNSLLPVQVLESGAFQSLGTTVSLVVPPSQSTLVARVKLTYEDGSEARVDVKPGDVEVLPLPAGHSGRLAIQPAAGVDAGFGWGKTGALSVSGGEMGVVVDGRGRPLALPEDGGLRRETIKKWQSKVGG